MNISSRGRWIEPNQPRPTPGVCVRVRSRARNAAFVWQVQNLEKEIVNILSDADPSELNYMLPKIGLGLLFYKVKDHAPINLHRTRLLNVLADTRISVRSTLSQSQREEEIRRRRKSNCTVLSVPGHVKV